VNVFPEPVAICTSARESAFIQRGELLESSSELRFLVDPFRQRLDSGEVEDLTAPRRGIEPVREERNRADGLAVQVEQIVGEAGPRLHLELAHGDAAAGREVEVGAVLHEPARGGQVGLNLAPALLFGGFRHCRLDSASFLATPHAPAPIPSPDPRSPSPQSL